MCPELITGGVVANIINQLSLRVADHTWLRSGWRCPGGKDAPFAFWLNSSSKRLSDKGIFQIVDFTFHHQVHRECTKLCGAVSDTKSMHRFGSLDLACQHKSTAQSERIFKSMDLPICSRFVSCYIITWPNWHSLRSRCPYLFAIFDVSCTKHKPWKY